MNAELEQIKARLAVSPAYSVGTKAFFDAHTVVFPCTVIQVIEPGDGVHVTVGRLKIRCDEDTGPYKKDEELEVPAYHTFPRKHRVVKGFHYTIDKWYRWVAANG
jgi:hypothetical protein